MMDTGEPKVYQWNRRADVIAPRDLLLKRRRYARIVAVRKSFALRKI